MFYIYDGGDILFQANPPSKLQSGNMFKNVIFLTQSIPLVNPQMVFALLGFQQLIE